MTVTREASVKDTKALKEAVHECKTDVVIVVGKVIKRKKSYNIGFPIGVVISHEEIN